MVVILEGKENTKYDNLFKPTNKWHYVERLTELRQWAFAFARTRDKERTTLSISSFVSNVIEYLPHSYSSILYHGKWLLLSLQRRSAPRAHPPALAKWWLLPVTAMKEKNGSSSSGHQKVHQGHVRHQHRAAGKIHPKSP